MKKIGKVERIESAGDAHLIFLILFDGNLPGTAPAQGSKPYLSMILVLRLASLDRKPRTVLVSCRSTTAFKDDLSGMHRLLLQAPLTRPFAGEVSKLIVACGGQIPGGGKCLFDRQWLPCLIFDRCLAAK